MNDIVSLYDEDGARITAPCPLCGAKSGVIDTRRWHRTTMRRRRCRACDCRWTTIEVPYDLAERLPVMEADLRRLAREAEAMANTLAAILRHLP